MTQNLNFKLVKWQEAISQVEKTGFKWHLILRLPILQSDLKCSHIHRKKKSHSRSLHGAQHLLQLYSNALQAHITHSPPVLPRLQHPSSSWWIIPWRDPSLSSDDTGAWTELYLASWAPGENNPRRNTNQWHLLCQEGSEIVWMQMHQLSYAFLSSPVIYFSSVVENNSHGTKDWGENKNLSALNTPPNSFSMSSPV